MGIIITSGNSGERTKFTSTRGVLEDFVFENKLDEPETITPVGKDSERIMAYWNDKNHVLLSSYSEDLSGWDEQFYVLSGKLNGRFVDIKGVIREPRPHPAHPKNVSDERYRLDKHMKYVFLGIKPKR